MARLDGAGLVNLGVSRGRDFLETISISGDFSADTFAAQVRLYPDAAGDPIATMTVSTPTYSDPVTTFTVSITDTVMSGGTIPSASISGGDVVLYWDLERTSSGIKSTFLHGSFTVFGRVTQ